MKSDAYLEDLAYIHDVGFDAFAKNAAPNLLEILNKSDIKSGKIIDLGCGTGVWAAALVKAGFDVLGIDISGAMIERARKRVPEAKFRTESFFSTRLPACRVVTALGESLGYLVDPKHDSNALVHLFKRVHDALQPKGLFIFDLLEPGQVTDSGGKKNHRVGDDWAVMVTRQEDAKHATLTRKITTFRKKDDSYRRSEETHRVALFKNTDIAKSLRNAGFLVRIVRGYGSLRFARSHVGYIARKTM